MRDLIAAVGNGRVLLATGNIGKQTHERAIRLGVKGIVLKDQPGPVLVRAVERVYAGEAWFSRTMMAVTGKRS